MLRERQVDIGKQLAFGGIMSLDSPQHFKMYGQCVGRYSEIEDLINTTYEEMKGMK